MTPSVEISAMANSCLKILFPILMLITVFPEHLTGSSVADKISLLTFVNLCSPPNELSNELYKLSLYMGKVPPVSTSNFTFLSQI